MTGTLATVSMRKGRGHTPRLSVPYDPNKPRHERFWSEADRQILRDNYGKPGGVDACRRLLPKRSSSSIFAEAHKLGLKARGQSKGRRRIEVTDELKQRIRDRWPSLMAKGAVTAYAGELGMAKHTLIKIATTLGLTVLQRKEPPWSDAENALMKQVPLHSPELAARMFRARGFNRTATAIVVRAKRLNLSRRYNETLSGTTFAKVLGVDNKTTTGWCVQGLIKATRRESRRLPQQGGAPWSIERADARQWIIDNIASIDIRKVDKVAFVDLLVTVAPAEAPTT